jgi:putative hydrolase of the HAD superfamily
MVLQALILDYGNVLSQPQDERWFEAMAAEIETAVDPFRAAYWRHRPVYDAGIPARDYWGRVLDTVGAGHHGENDGPVIDRLIHADVASWTKYREEMWELARSFRGKGGRTAFLSNGVPEAMARIRTDRPLEGWFDVVIVSCEVGVAKPDPAIFQMCLSRLSVEPGQALFVDDRIENIEGAARLGIQTFHFVGADAVSRLVRSVRSLLE